MSPSSSSFGTLVQFTQRVLLFQDSPADIVIAVISPCLCILADAFCVADLHGASLCVVFGFYTQPSVFFCGWMKIAHKASRMTKLDLYLL